MSLSRHLLSWTCPLLLASACAESESFPTRWSAERLRQDGARDESLRWSQDNVSRPLWTRSRQSRVDVNPEAGAVLRVALAPEKVDTPWPLSLEQVRISFARNGKETELPLRVGEPESGGSRPWWSLEALLDAAPSGGGTLQVQIDGMLAHEAGYLLSTPLRYQRKDLGDRPNVVIITVDTLRADVLSCYGYDRPTAPHLDGLAAESMLFERAVSQGCWTLPSYATLFSGQYAVSHGVVHRDHEFADGQVSFVELFAEAGYTTGAVVSGTFTDSHWGFDQGFDSYDDLGMVTDDNQTLSEGFDPKEAMARAEKRVTSEEVTDKALRWLDQQRERRFLLLVHYFDPHSDLVEHPGFSEKFPPRPVPSRYVPEPVQAGMRLPRRGTPQEAAGRKALYEGEVAFTDHHIGRLLEHLRETGLDRETIVVFCADHGDEFLDRVQFGHGHSLFNELVNVPLMFRVPGSGFGAGRCARPVGNLDIATTLLDLCGIEAEKRMQGRSLVELLKDPASAWDHPVYSSRFQPMGPAGQRGPLLWWRVDRGDLTLIESQSPPLRPMLFDWTQDAPQTVNLLPGRIDAAREMRQLYQQELPVFQELLPPVETVVITEDIRDTLDALGYHRSDEPDGGDEPGSGR